MSIDTTLVGNGGPGPYSLGNRFVDTATIRCAFADTSHGSVPSFTYVGIVNGLLFSEPIDSGIALSVSYRVSHVSLLKTVLLYEKAYQDTNDTSALSASTNQKSSSATGASENLTISGYKSIGVSVGSVGQMNLDQGLDVTVFGDINASTELSAHIADQGTSLEGATREISDLDQVYVTLKNPRYTVTVGDQYIQWINNGLLTGSKKIKGIGGSFTPGFGALSAFGALSGGKFALQTMSGQNGLQGPYYLRGNGEPDIISPINGTVKVVVDGITLQEGENNHYMVDYDLGTITFTPRFLITQDKIIKVEYEYKTFDYQRIIAGTGASMRTRDSSLMVDGALWNESDIKEQPIDLVLAPADIKLLQQAGDSLGTLQMRRLVLPYDVPSTDQLMPLYTLDTAGHYVYTPFDPRYPQRNTGFYLVNFLPVSPGAGDYRDTIVTDIQNRRRSIRIYVGPGNGNIAAPEAAPPLPQRTTRGEIRAAYRPSSLLAVLADVAGLDQDRNVYSSRNDDNNNGIASALKAELGKKTFETRTVWFDAEHHLVTRDYSEEVVSAFENRSAWDYSYPSTGRTQKQNWGARAGGTILKNLGVEAAYGQLWNGSLLITDRTSNYTRVPVGRVGFFSYDGAYFRHFDSLANQRTRTDGISLLLPFKHAEYTLRGFDEWRTYKTGIDRGHIGGSFDWSFKPFLLDESFEYAESRKGTKEIFASPDTATDITWKQSFDKSLRPGWQVRAASTYHRAQTNDNHLSTVLVSAANEVSVLRAGFSTSQHYTVNSEKASAYVQVPVYAGEGLGDYIYDDSLHEFVPKAGGNYFMQRQEVYDNAVGGRVRRQSLEAAWSWYPVNTMRGILRDLKWRGEYNANEQILITPEVPGLSWIPSYLTISRSTPDSTIPSSYCSYRQTVLWSSDSFPGWQSELRVEPFVRKEISLREHGLTASLEIERSWKKWFASGQPEWEWADHEALGTGFDYTFSLQDLSLQLTEKYLLPHDIRLYIEETPGWAEKKGTVGAARGWYGSVKPGLSWQPVDKGWADASYTFSYVTIPGDLDYRMARGNAGGISHIIDIFADVKVGQHFSVNATYRGELVKPLKAKDYDKATHVVSVEVKALL